MDAGLGSSSGREWATVDGPRLRIALLAPFALHPKGTTRWRVMPLARALAAAGHAVRVVVPPYDWPTDSGRRWTDRGVDLINVPLPRRPGGAGYAEMTARVLRCAVDWRPDVVHCFKPTGYSGLATAALLRWPRPRVVAVDADDWEAAWLNRAGYPAAARTLGTWLERWLLRRADVVTAASRWLAAWITALRGAPERVCYLPNGFEAVGEPGRPRADGRTVLLYTRFVEHTAGEVWTVWRQVLEAEPAARLLVAGRGLHGEERQLLALAEAGGAGQTVRLLGWVPTASRPGLFAATDAAVLPVADTPLTRAKGPVRLAEMLAAGVPVATQAVGEYAAYVRHDETGLLAPAGDLTALAGAAVRLLRDPDLRGRLGARAVQVMRTEYAWNRLAGLAEGAYRRVVG